MIDFSTNIGGGTKRVPQVRYNYKLGPATQLFVSAEKRIVQHLLQVTLNIAYLH